MSGDRSAVYNGEVPVDIVNDVGRGSRHPKLPRKSLLFNGGGIVMTGGLVDMGHFLASPFENIGSVVNCPMVAFDSGDIEALPVCGHQGWSIFPAIVRIEIIPCEMRVVKNIFLCQRHALAQFVDTACVRNVPTGTDLLGEMEANQL